VHLCINIANFEVISIIMLLASDFSLLRIVRAIRQQNYVAQTKAIKQHNIMQLL